MRAKYESCFEYLKVHSKLAAEELSVLSVVGILRMTVARDFLNPLIGVRVPSRTRHGLRRSVIRDDCNPLRGGLSERGVR